MILYLLLGVGLLALMLLVSRWYATVETKTLAEALKWVSLILLVALVAFLALSGRLAWAVAALTGLATWAARFMRIHWLYRTMKGVFGSSHWGGGPPPKTSEVVTRILRMRLDHDSGQMDGEVLEGLLAGRALSSLSRTEAEVVERLCQADDDSLQVYLAWRARTHPEWEEPQPSSAASSSGVMSPAEAWAALGLGPGASPQDIQAAYKRLMSKLHPDAGGSTYLAAKLNQARDTLLSL